MSLVLFALRNTCKVHRHEISQAILVRHLIQHNCWEWTTPKCQLLRTSHISPENRDYVNQCTGIVGAK
ncbi:DUF5448 family protein, partial [Salmonella enterica]|uniref:DUF5448 family protein n=1 Tax=Salmonella enterica TaxID=28901 RepID=UPI0039F1442C